MTNRPQLAPDILLKALEEHAWVIADTALYLEVSRQAIYDALKRHGLRRKPLTKAQRYEMRGRGAEAREANKKQREREAGRQK